MCDLCDYDVILIYCIPFVRVEFVLIYSSARSKGYRIVALSSFYHNLAR